MRTGKKVKMDQWGNILLLFLICSVCPVSAAPVAKYSSGPSQMVRTELYFGAIPRSQWDGFLKQVVTPLFPEGLTWFDVQGQWRASDGVTRKLPSRMLIVLYADSRRNDQAIEQIRREFKNQFHHLAVLRVSMKVEAVYDDWHPNRGLKRSAQYK
ncbi:MAG TPA: DUF3574 domain-containing protein [Chthoniobacterales bacterium]|nr:DUF3574 domain-containing protein [Chthoniobacterales bacterium]